MSVGVVDGFAMHRFTLTPSPSFTGAGEERVPYLLTARLPLSARSAGERAGG